MKITANTKICMIVGDPVEHSLSPLMHNAGYEALGIDNKFAYIATNVKIKDIGDFVNGARAMNIRGISCTIPHKIEIMKYLDHIDSTALKIGAVNTVVNDNGVLKGYNTDWLGIITPLEKIANLKGKTVAVLGAGGAARAATYGLSQKGARIHIYNRSIKKAKELASEFGGLAFPMDELRNVKKADIIINATPIGLVPNTEGTPISAGYIAKNQIVFDLIYTPFETTLLKNAREQGAKIIHGVEMFIYQGAEQFKLYTGIDAPIDEMRKSVLNTLINTKTSYKNNYCLPIIKKQKNAIFELINSNINEYDYFEIWLDYIEGVDEEFIKSISEQLSEKAIFLFRRKNLEAIKMDFKKRIEIISLLTKTNSYLDLDILQQKEELNYIKNNKLDMKIIISYHNYQETPTDNKLNEITDIINKYNPAIIKISTYCQKENDSIRLLNKLLELKRQNEKVIVSGMGEKGKIVKIIGALWGNEITFAPLSKEESSAPGQLTIDQLKTIHEILNT